VTLPTGDAASSAPTGRRHARIILLGVGLVLAYLAATARASEELEPVIAGAVGILGEACLQANLGRADAFKEQAAAYWSAATPTSRELAPRTRTFARLWPTVDPVVDASIRGTAVAQLALGSADVPTTTLHAILEYEPPEPDFSPGDAPLGDVRMLIDRCQESAVSELPDGFGIREIRLDPVLVLGPRAEVSASITMWRSDEWYGDEPRVFTERSRFELRREAGSWKVSEYEVLTTDPPMTW
jgi:hypothetical protein